MTRTRLKRCFQRIEEFVGNVEGFMKRNTQHSAVLEITQVKPVEAQLSQTVAQSVTLDIDEVTFGGSS